MALQDLTPQLRTRLSRVERAVGLFVTIATLLLVIGFAYYVYHTAKRKGWFATKIVYETGLNNAAGLKPGDKVKLMGFDVGEILEVIPNKPGAWYGVTVRFEVQEPNYGYIWTDSKVRVAPADFLGNRYVEVLKGQYGIATVLEENEQIVGVLTNAAFQKFTNQLYSKALDEVMPKVRAENPSFNKHALLTEASNEVAQEFPKLVNSTAKNLPDNALYLPRKEVAAIWIDPLESPALTERLETMVSAVEGALPNVLNLTNQLTEVLTSTAEATSHLNQLLADSRPIITNLTEITGNLREPKGSLGEWLFPTNISLQLEQTLVSAKETLAIADKALATTDKTLASTDTNLTLLVSNLNLSLENLANLTSNLNSQVQANTNIVSSINTAIVDADSLVQGLKRHWLLRSAFKSTNEADKAESKEPSEDSLDTPKPAHPGTRR